MRTLISLLVLCSLYADAQPKSAPFWRYELPEDIQLIKPIVNGSFVFLQADEFAWVYETATGKKIWSAEVKKYDKDALHHLVYDSLYLVSSADTLLCYGILQNKLLWKKHFPGIEQDRYSGLATVDTVAVLSFRSIDLGINIETGKELWRTNIEYENGLVEKGTVNSIILPAAGKRIVFTSDDDVILYSLMTGKPLSTRKKSVPHSDLIEQKRQWYYIAKDESFAVMVLSKGVLALNLETGKELAFVPMDIDEQFNILVPTESGCVVVGSEKTIHIDAQSGKYSEFTVDADDIRKIVVAETDSGLVMVISMENAMAGINLQNRKTLWRTPEKFPAARGYIHRYIGADENSIIVTYLDRSDDVKLYVMSIDALTGAIKYRTLAAHSDESLPKRNLPLAVAPIPAAVHDLSFGYDDPGFHYSAQSDDADLHLLIHTSAEMIEPNTDLDGGEGYTIVNAGTGKVTKKTYMKIGHDLSFKGGFTSLAAPLTYGKLKILPGNKNLIAIDTTNASLKWMLIEQDLFSSYVIDMALADSMLYVRTGGTKVEYVRDEKKDKVERNVVWEEDDYSLIAVNAGTGMVYWKKKLNDDPAPVFPSYSIAQYLLKNGDLLYATEKFLFAQFLQTKKADSLRWKFEFSDSGVGSYSYDELLQSSMLWSGERFGEGDECRYQTEEIVPFSTKMIAGEKFVSGYSRILQVNYCLNGNLLIAIGEDGIASIDPENGKKKWYYEWDYSADDVLYRPVFVNNHLFYVMNGKADLLNLNTGRIAASVKIDKESGIFIMPNGSSVIIVYKDELTGIRIR
ncbi:MAG: outer membrane protein assembly factor BamB family protein [Bacteroidota bacterium]